MEPERVLDTEPSLHAPQAVAGIRFELRDLHRVPLREAEDTVRITYAGQTLPPKIAYSGSRSAAALRRARLATAAEYSVLVLLCLALVPVLALLIAVDLYVLSDRNEFVTLASVVVTLGLGYGALAAILAGAGKQVPTPRRAIRRTRAAVAELRRSIRAAPGSSSGVEEPRHVSYDPRVNEILSRRLKDISPKAYEHPADRAATAALQSIPGLDPAIRALVEMRYERAYRQTFMASAMRVGPRAASRGLVDVAGGDRHARPRGRLRRLRPAVARR